MTKIVNIKGIDWEITKPEDMYAELEKSSDAGYRVSDWAWEHAKYIGKNLTTGSEHWLPYNYKQFITKYIH